jgi:hypothetical protein
MQPVWRSLLVFLFAPSLLARWMDRIWTWLERMDARLADPGSCEVFATGQGRWVFERLIVQGEDWLGFLIFARAAEIAGLGYTYADRTDPSLRTPSTPQSFPDLLRRYRRLRHGFSRLDRLARRRAVQLKSLLSRDPPCLQSTAETPRHRLAAPAQRGRWIATPSSRDGGGCLQPPGPPFNSPFRNPITPPQSAASEDAPAWPFICRS